MLDPKTINTLKKNHILFICEGSAERVIIEKLLEADKLIISKQQAILDSIENRPTTTCRKAKKVQETFLEYDYDGPVAIVRIIDSLQEKFKLSSPYNKIPVYSFYTRPEIEMLAIIKENQYDQYNQNRKSYKPSDFCKQKLNLSKIKQEKFLQNYWNDPEEICKCIQTYNQKHSPKKGEHSLADLLK